MRVPFIFIFTLLILLTYFVYLHIFVYLFNFLFIYFSIYLVVIARAWEAPSQGFLLRVLFLCSKCTARAIASDDAVSATPVGCVSNLFSTSLTLFLSFHFKVNKYYIIRNTF